MSQEESSYHNNQIQKFAKDEAEVVDVVLVMNIVSEKLKIVEKHLILILIVFSVKLICSKL